MTESRGSTGVIRFGDKPAARPTGLERQGAGARAETTRPPEPAPSFHASFVELFEAHHARLYRVMHRISAEPELAADLVQEAFVRLYRRGSLPDAPAAWLISVAMNLYRNEKSTRSRRMRLLTPVRGERVLADPPPPPEDAVAGERSRRRVRGALDRLPERERRMLLLRADGYSYRDIAEALNVKESSVGVLLLRARRAFRKAYENG